MVFKNILKGFVASDFFKYLIFASINAVISFTTIFLLAKYLSAEEYGKFGILMTIVYFLPSILSFSTDQLQAVNITKLNKIEYVDYRNDYINFVFLIFITLFFSSYFFTAETLYNKLFFNALFLSFFMWASSLHSIELIQNRKSILFGLINVADSILIFLFSILFLLFWKKNWEARSFALISAEIIVVILRIFIFSDIFKEYKFKLNFLVFKKFVIFGFPLILTIIPGWVLNQLDKYLLLKYFDITKVGYYTFAASISGIIVLISQSLQKAFRPTVYDELKLNGNLYKLRKKLLLFSISIFSVSLLLAIGFLFFFNYHPQLKFSEAKYIVFLSIISQSLFSIYSLFVMVLEYFKFNQIKSKIVWLSSFIFILSNISFLKVFNYYTPAISSLIAFGFLASSTFFKVKKYI